MKKMILITALLSMALLASSCSVKQGQLVVLEKDTNNDKGLVENLTLDFNVMPQKASIEQNVDIIKKLDPSMIPIAVSETSPTVIGMEFVNSIETEDTNSKVITGNMIQPINLYSINASNNEKKSIGKFISLKDFKFDETGKHFAFIDGLSDIYIYSIETDQLQMIIDGKNYNSYDTVNWSRDSKKLLINQKMSFDIPSKQLISFPVDAYNPFVAQRYNNKEVYIVQMKNNEYNDMIALYNFDSKSFKSLANGIFKDSDNINLIYTRELQSGLQILNLETLESRSIDQGPIYQAKIMKSTGDILYTTVNPDLTSTSRYLLIKINPSSGSRKTVPLNTPTFFLSPAEDKAYFVGSSHKTNLVVVVDNFNVSTTVNENEKSDLFDIKTAILMMFQLDYNFIGTYEEYEAQARMIYANNYEIVPQEALENKLIDYKRFNMPLPTWQKEPAVPPTILLNSFFINGNKASVNIGLFYINSIELSKEEGTWKIVGFSTHPNSKEIKEVRAAVQKHISDIKNRNKKDALKYWQEDKSLEFNEKQIKIVEDLMKEADSLKFEIGETELWSRSEPHRAESADTAAEAKVKIVLGTENNNRKYKLVLTKNQNKEFVVSSWSIDPLSISQLH